MVKLGVLRRGKATRAWSKAMCACGRLAVPYSLWWMARATWAQAPSFGLCRPLAFVVGGSAWFVVLRPTIDLRTQA
jgi:hypothetical protein